MSSLFNNKYRISSARLQAWDYGNAGMYFITICTKNREFYFGEIFNPILDSAMDCFVVVETRCIASLPPQNNPQNNPQNSPPKTSPMQLSPIGKIAEAEWIKAIELRPDMNLELGEFVVMPNHFHGIMIIHENQYNSNGNLYANRFGPQSKNLASIIRGYKSAVTTYARKNNIPFDWQPRFHDHIIRSADEYYRISNYIVNNPAEWQKDRFFRK